MQRVYKKQNTFRPRYLFSRVATLTRLRMCPCIGRRGNRISVSQSGERVLSISRGACTSTASRPNSSAPPLSLPLRSWWKQMFLITWFSDFLQRVLRHLDRSVHPPLFGEAWSREFSLSARQGITRLCLRHGVPADICSRPTTDSAASRITSAMFPAWMVRKTQCASSSRRAILHFPILSRASSLRSVAMSHRRGCSRPPHQRQERNPLAPIIGASKRGRA